MNQQAIQLNQTIEKENPSILQMLSERGKEIFFPKKGILGQSADAKSANINATIGTAVNDDGSPMRLSSIENLVKLKPEQYFPYAPSFGRMDLRERWKELIYSKNPSIENQEISLPVVTNALTHGISMVGYLFLDADDKVLVPNMFWGNYNLALTNAYQAQLQQFNLFKDGGFDMDAFSDALMAEGSKKVVILNFPNNPTGYTPTNDEFEKIREAVLKAAEAGKHLVMVCDDAYFGLVYEEGIAKESIFSKLTNLHKNVLAIKLDGATKEDYAWGFRVGFISYGVKNGSAELYSALENKTAGAVRGNISNASNLSQSLLLEAYNNKAYNSQKQEKYNILKDRYDEVKQVLENNEKYKQYFNALPYNSGYFMCVKLAEGIDGEELRQLLIEKYGIGVINLNNVLRVAYSAISVKQISPLFEGIYSACAELS